MSLKTGKSGLLIGVLILFGFGCSSLETVSGDRSMIYDQDFDTMIEVVEKAIRGRSLAINYAARSDDGNRYHVIFHATSYVDNSVQPTDEGEVIIERIDDGKTKVIIHNPEYHYTVPSHHREKYDKELKEEIEKILEE